MRAAKIPEQVADRSEAGLRAMLEDQKPDPVIERLKAMPIIRQAKTPDKRRQRTLSDAAVKHNETVSKRLVNEGRLKGILLELTKLGSTRQGKRTKAIEDRIALLGTFVKRLRSILIVKKVSKKQPKKSRSTKKPRIFTRKR